MSGAQVGAAALWPPGAATGIGSLPGTDIGEALTATFGELPDLPYLPELPSRGPGADMIGRSAALLAGLPIELYAGRWRTAARPGVDLRRAHDLWERDLDSLAELADGYTGPLKVQLAGPWTLAAALNLPQGGRLLRDRGAVRDLAGSLAEGIRAHLAELARRVPGAALLLQLDEPSLPSVLKAQVPTDSGLDTYRAVAAPDARDVLAALVSAAEVPVLAHCCAADPPIGLLHEAGFAGLALDLSQVHNLDPLGAALDAGMWLLAGAAPTQEVVDRQPDADALANRVQRLLSTLGLESRVAQVAVTPACGLAGASPSYARAVLAACREAARRLTN